jgi:hypothetical protein
MSEFSSRCARCGLCCLTFTCQVGQWLFKVGEDTRPCPGLKFVGDEAGCNAYEFAVRQVGKEQADSAMGIGVGCCIKAKGYDSEKDTNYATYPPYKKRAYVQELLDGRNMAVIRVKGKKMEKGKCEFYPEERDGCVCACGSDISGLFVCTVAYSLDCEWAKERRMEDDNRDSGAS